MSGSEASLGLAWQSAFGCGWILRLLHHHAPELIWGASRRDLEEWGLTKAAIGRFEQRRRDFRPLLAAAHIESAALRFVAYGDREYPAQLRELPQPPAGLFVRGMDDMTPVLRVPRVVIVGTRKPTPYGVLLAEAFACAFARAGVLVVSGMALGIDGRSHQGALKEGAASVAVLGCGADVIYPRAHRKLYGEIAENGAVLSELPPGTAPSRWTFPQRNRVLAALGDAVLVVEAGASSGALQTADWALELGRPVFAVPGPVTGENHRGTNRLIYEGAFPALDPVVTVEDFLLLTRIERGDRLPASFVDCRRTATGGLFGQSTGLVASDRGGTDGPAPLGPAELKVLGWLGAGMMTVDAIAEGTSLSVREVTGALARLQLRGAATRLGPGLFIRAP